MGRSQAVGTGAAGRWTAAVPLVCAVHCVAAPLLVAAAPAFAAASAVEPLAQAATALFAGVMAAAGVRAHRRAAVLLPLAAGLALWLAALAAGLEGAAETLVVVAGALLVAGGLWWNGRLRHAAACHACGCPSHGPDD